MDRLERFSGSDVDYAAGIAAQVLRRWRDPKHRAWFAECKRLAAEVIEKNQDTKIPLLELPRTTVRSLKSRSAHEVSMEHMCRPDASAYDETSAITKDQGSHLVQIQEAALWLRVVIPEMNLRPASLSRTT
jgi:hypothetical protein